MVKYLPEAMTLAVALIAVVAELLHWRRTRRVSNLAFGPHGKPARWTIAVPLLRVSGWSAACWGFLSLLLAVEARVHNQKTIAESDWRHLVLIVDVSPSMQLEDAGPEGKESRRLRASNVLESLFKRLPSRNFKVSVIGVYSEAKTILEDSKDVEVVRHIMEKMPMWHAFEPGKTDLMSGISLAAQLAKSWNPKSTYVIMFTDGDTIPPQGMPKMPASIAEFVVVGIGDSEAGSFIDDHQSRQDVSTLRQIANRLNGTFHNGNKKHLSSQLVAKFDQSEGEAQNKSWTRREWAIFAALAGSGIVSLLPILLHYFGSRYRPGVKESTGTHLAMR